MASRTRLAAALLHLSSLASIISTSRADPTTYSLSFSKTGFGPDGPWNVINQTVDFPDQYILMYPSLSETSVFVPTSACKGTNANCPEPLPGLWGGSGAQNLFADENGPSFNAATWDNLSQPLGLQGTGHYMTDRITLQASTANAATGFLDGQVITTADNFSISYPGGARYTMDTGLFSLYGADNTFTYQNQSGSQVTLNTTLAAAYLAKYIPSKSYGLHIGSSAYTVPATLILGGWDSSRVLSDPVVGNSDDTFQLRQLSFNVSSGGSAYSNIHNSPSTLNGTTQTPNLKVRLEPGAPYLYLPRAVCDSMAKYLPVSYNKDFDLYTWNTNTNTYQSIISSPHYLSLTFSDATTQNPTNTTSINIPLALLSLNLTAPLSTTTTAYFPCRPYSPSDGSTYILGRAFLQTAFLAQNWNAGKLWLAQAPGPYLPPGTIMTFTATDGSVAPKGNQVPWDTTWSTVLKPLASSIDSGNAASNSNSSTSGLSTGAKAGIGIGVALGVLVILGAILLVCLQRRRRRRRIAAAPGGYGAEAGAVEADAMVGQHKADAKFAPPMAQNPRAELPVDQQRHEMDGGSPEGRQALPKPGVLNVNEGAPTELPGDTRPAR